MNEPVRACTGLTASWCPVHGDCCCVREDRWDGTTLALGSMADPACPLHSPDSLHAVAVPIHGRLVGDQLQTSDGATFRLPGGRMCPVHVGVAEPCPTCRAYIAAGL